MSNITIYTVSHKKVDVDLPAAYKIIAVGNYPLNEDVIYDSTQDNIASKNSSFCELTALYWIWKNDKSDIAGLVHYRRFFTNKINVSPKVRILNRKSIAKILTNNDIIVPRVVKLKKDKKLIKIKNHYANAHYIKDLEMTRDVIEELSPQYVRTFDKVMDETSMFMFNMFIAKKSVLDSYSSWLFPILFELEKRIYTANYDAYQKRVIGFIAERLFNVWIIHHSELKVKHYPFINTDEGVFKQNITNTIKLYRKK